MISCQGRYIVTFVFILISLLEVKSQDKRKISFNLMAGPVFFPKSEKVPTYGMLPGNIFGAYSLSGMAGVGLNYRLSEKAALFENLTFLHTSKKNNSLSASAFKTGIKYQFLDKKISPFVFGSIDLSLLFLNRKENSTDYYLDSTTNTIGQGYGGTKITYNEERLKLSFVPILGASAGAGINFKISNKTHFFLAYNYNTSFASRSHIIKKNFFNNKSDLTYHSVNAGLTIYLFKKTKQLLASLGKDAWEGDKTVSVRGTVVYHKNKKSNNKVVPVQLTNEKDSTLKMVPSDKEGTFMLKDLTCNDYKFMLEKRNRKIKNADLEVIHDHRKVKVADEFLSLDMFDDFESENLISREGNFSVVLREGFQHEVDLSVTGMSISGKLNNVVPDTSCNEIEVLLYDQKDSLIKGVPASKDCSFNVNDVIPGQYKMVFRNGKDKGKISFDYQFTEAVPVVTRQVNDVAPKVTYFINGKVYIEDSLNAQKIDLHLVDKLNKVLQKTSLIPPGEFAFNELSSGEYQINYELTDKKAKGKIQYLIQADNSAFKKEFIYYFGKTIQDTVSKYSGKGQLRNNLSKSMEGTDVYLMDLDHNVIEKTKADKDGYFHFPKLPSKDYKITYALEDTSLKADFKYAIIDENTKLPVSDVITDEVFYSATAVRKVSVENKVKIGIAKVKKDQKVISGTPMVNKPETNQVEYSSFKTHQTYSINGDSIRLTGFGVQVGSFKQIANLKKNISYLKEKGYTDIYIQVVTLAFGGKEEKLYRVVLGVYEDLNELREREQALKKAGYTTTFRKHI
jgi:hypothetical protein